MARRKKARTAAQKRATAKLVAWGRAHPDAKYRALAKARGERAPAAKKKEKGHGKPAKTHKRGDPSATPRYCHVTAEGHLLCKDAHGHIISRNLVIGHRLP